MKKATGIWDGLLHSLPNKIVLCILHFLCIPISSTLSLSWQEPCVKGKIFCCWDLGWVFFIEGSDVMKQFDGEYSDPLSKHAQNWCRALPTAAESPWPLQAVQTLNVLCCRRYLVSFQQQRREQEFIFSEAVLAKSGNCVTVLDCELVQILIHIGLGFPHTDLYRLDPPNPTLHIFAFFIMVHCSEEVCKKTN